MQKTNKSGLALGAIFALVTSAFVGIAPAQANESAAVISPLGAEAATQNSMIHTETFDMRLRYGTAVVGVNPDASSGSGSVPNAHVEVVANSASALITLDRSPDASILAAGNGTRVVLAGSSSTTVSVTAFGEVPSNSAFVTFGLAGLTSVSPAVSLTVTPYLELDGVAGKTSGDSVGASYVINFVPWRAMGATAVLSTPRAGDQGATASVTVTQGSIRWSQLNGSFGVAFASTNDEETAASGTTVSAQAAGVATPATTVTRTGADLITANYSFSAAVLTAPLSGSPVASISANLIYFASAPATDDDVTSAILGRSLTGTLSAAVVPVNSVGVSISAVTGPNALHKVTHGTADARFNSTFSVRAFAFSASNTTSIAVPVAITVSGIADMELNANAGVVLNGVTYTQSARLLAAGFTLPAGTSTFVVETFGQLDNSGDSLTLMAVNGLQEDEVVISFIPATLTAIYTPTAVSGQAGTSRTFALTVQDQWKQKPLRTDLRIAASVVLGGSTSETVSAPVVAGAASVAVTPTPATRTGSATVTFTLQRFDQDVQAWVNGGTSDTATWNIFSYAAGTDAITSRTASISASISYGVDLSWSSAVIAVKVRNSFSDVVVSAPGLMIQNSDVATQTASDTLTINAATGQNVNVKFTSRLAGTYTVTFTNGTATTTSQVVVNPARDADGATITFDTTAIAAGSTKLITGTLRDINGNPVNTSGSATILVGYTVTGNAGIPIGTMPTETDADGKFTITVLTGANDAGTAVVSAAYYKSGAATPVAQVLTFNQSIVVGGAATAPASDQKLTVGSFKGFVAIYALNYTGQKLSAKVAGKWLTVNNLSRFQRVVRNTGAAIPIVVDLYIDGKLVRTENIVTK
jgi:trimeric autotransporter adhesin